MARASADLPERQKTLIFTYGTDEEKNAFQEKERMELKEAFEQDLYGLLFFSLYPYVVLNY